MVINGARYEFRDGLTLHALFAELQVDSRRVVVMHGDAIYRAGKAPDVPLAEQDVIEIVKMMQGG